MSVVKVRIQKDFTVLYNGVLENPRLSFKAKGLWAYCMSRPDNWQFHVTHLAKVSKDGVDAIYSALKELEAEGLVVKSQKNEGGRFGPVDYIIYPYPQEIQKILPLPDFPETEDPQTENPALTSTDSSKRIEEDYVCPASPDLGKVPTKVKKKSADGSLVEASIDEFFRIAVREKKDWGTDEIIEVWSILVSTNEKIRDPYLYMEGTIENLRKKRRFEKMKQGTEKQEKSCRTTNNEDRTKPLQSNPAIDMLALLLQA